MQAFGSDRVREGEDEQVILACRLSKGWTPRVSKTLTSAEFPGTAVLWEERYFEVVRADDQAQGGVRYVLEPWRDSNAMRVTDRYDAETESQRIEEHRLLLQREKGRKSANAMGVFTGHLPAIVQHQLAMELGILPPRLTFLSILSTYVLIVAIVLVCVSDMMRHEAIPAPLFIIAVYLGIENTARVLIYWTQNRPIGSTIGWLAYLLYWGITRRGPSPFDTQKGYAVKVTQAPAEVARRDSFAVREAFVTLLSPEDQARVAQRFGYDYRRDSGAMAAMILIVAIIGMVSSYVRGNPIAFVAAGLLGAEQIMRLIAFRRGPAASVLRFVVRPFVRKLL
jgi:hypothetical protein